MNPMGLYMVKILRMVLHTGSNSVVECPITLPYHCRMDVDTCVPYSRTVGLNSWVSVSVWVLWCRIEMHVDESVDDGSKRETEATLAYRVEPSMGVR